MNGGEIMKNFVGFTSNSEYSVGCTGQTVYLYDKDSKELAKFNQKNAPSGRSDCLRRWCIFNGFRFVRIRDRVFP